MIFPAAPATYDDVFVGLASIPERVSSLEKVIEQLLPQAARIGVYLNGYADVPRFLRNERIEVARSQQHGDVRDNGKFFFLASSDCRFYATVDDDIFYPADYLGRLVATLADAGTRSAVGVHGASYPCPVLHAFESRVLLHFEHRVPHVMPVQLLGTGTTLIDQHEWQLGYEEFGTPGMADIWFARAAAERGFPMFAVARKRRWLRAIRTEDGGALFHEGLRRNSQQLDELRSMQARLGGFDNLVGMIANSPPLIGRLSVHQSLRLDAIRSELGLAPLSPDTAIRVFEALRTQRSTWECDPHLTNDERSILDDVVMSILKDEPVGGQALEAIDILQRINGLRSRVPMDWEGLPESLRIDTSTPQVEESTASLLQRALHDDRVVADEVWRRVGPSHGAPVDLTIAAASRGAGARLERNAAFAERAGDQPIAAAGALRRYLEGTGWRLPDINELRRLFGSAFAEPEVSLPIGVAASRSGHEPLANRLVAESRVRYPWDPDLRLWEASLSAGPDDDLGRIKSVFDVLDASLEAGGLRPYQTLFDDSMFENGWIHSMRSQPVAPAQAVDPSRTVSVIMTTHNDESTIVPAMRSVLASVGVRVELIVVDDSSTDRTADLVGSTSDERVVFVRNRDNVGPYVSRNVALERATGLYVAIADGDDWSHPERLLHQVRYLETHSAAWACKVGHLRLLPGGSIDLENHGRFLGDGPMSLMYRRTVVDHLGGFDHIRTRGDMEFMRRLTARFGTAALVTLGVPMVLAMSTPSSNSKRFSEADLAAYRTAARDWHRRRVGSNELFVALRGQRAPFIAPYRLRVDDSGGGWSS